MRVAWAVLSAVLLQVVAGSDDQYEVPEPVIDVYSPKGLRISLPDSKDVKSVEFFINFPTCPEPHIQEINHTTGGYWIYWNPEASLRLNDKLRYRLMIQRNGLYWKKEGTHVVDKVTPYNGTDCPESQAQKIISVVPVLTGLEDRKKAAFTTAKSSNFKSSYSTQKTSELKPITKSSMSTTSGTFFIKPSGVMEATGYKKGSTFDSTKREGEQWEHYQSELTAEELENMKNLYGTGFAHFPQLHSAIFPAAKVYEKSYMSSESKTLPSIRYSEPQPPVTTHQFHQTHRESSTYSQSKPVFQFSDVSGGSAFSEGSTTSENRFRIEPLTALPNPLPPQGTIFKATEFIRQEHTAPVVESAPQKIVQGEFSSRHQQGEFSSRNQQGEFSSGNQQEVLKPVYRGDQLEYRSGRVETVEREESSSRSGGSIFSWGGGSGRAKSAGECNGVEYGGVTGDVREVERSVKELRCLASVAERSVKEELSVLKQKNSELKRKLEMLEQEVKRISSTCNCY